ncbi:hypothetical protein ABVK25_008601 [Lepraria finkii]|uniref:Uncharacterized protein n=1 Tax=Lepraria finkii TaxID=1340010 RepID=A0ABR4AZV8_9LECA
MAILLVHGLIGHALHTREDSQGINWITNPKFLPKSLPTARAMKLGYNANPLSNLVTSRVLDHADGLLAPSYDACPLPGSSSDLHCTLVRRDRGQTSPHHRYSPQRLQSNFRFHHCSSFWVHRTVGLS